MKRTFGDYFYAATKQIYNCVEKKRLFSKKYTFINRKKDSNNLLLIVAGFQKQYWEVIFNRVFENQKLFKEDMDVCICIPGENYLELAALAEKYDWSLLRIEKDLLAQAQNTAIKLFDKAEWIFKIDEDIILPYDYFSKMKGAYRLIEKKHDKQIGMLTPLINLNANGIRPFLEAMDMFDDYQNKFGDFRVELRNIVHGSPKIAEYIWKHSIPFDKVAKKIEHKNEEIYKECSIRLSIGCILFKRVFWNNIGGFVVKGVGTMGAEEEQVNAFCMNEMMSIIMVENIFVGHMGFYNQKQAVSSFFEKNIEDFQIDNKYWN